MYKNNAEKESFLSGVFAFRHKKACYMSPTSILALSRARVSSNPRMK